MVIVMPRSLDVYIDEMHQDSSFFASTSKSCFVSMKNLSHWWPSHLLLTWLNFSKDTSWSRPLMRNREMCTLVYPWLPFPAPFLHQEVATRRIKMNSRATCIKKSWTILLIRQSSVGSS